GITQRMLFPFASRIFVSFEKTRGAIDPSRKRVVGNPVRGNILAVSGRPDEKQAEKTEKKDRLTILVLGGSQGAHALNQAMTNALCHLEPLSRLRVVHQTGEKDQDAVAAAYARHGVEAEVEVFFHDMAACYQQTDLVICRAGATTIAELAALGKPAIFVPYPFAADNHQEHNARFLVDQGAGRMILEKDLTGPALAGEINEMAASPDLLARMADGIRRLGRPDAAEKIVEDCCQLLKAGACT
ncbi:UDP-N-acetylglucosamine--N-acetylmuramyl-(pentapeptide) pyrophosphoryl-undecaprenol N-acetylglucosamine transferase, partial [Desulfosarcina sp. OttesenSCG-928-B08]|nr:UDP-N-acetylglucosamine--N-acetylmuramyl-(pentapeptide) pyrophosphoryl-undecaprenol N-acetylglucosamine transferase [Desulfosarcina sp. OttesenSCG-928-B08]